VPRGFAPRGRSGSTVSAGVASPSSAAGDIAGYHLLVDPTERRLAAVLDFGTAGVGDRAVDVAALLHVFGESVVTPHFQEFGDFDEVTLHRTRFWCATLDLQLALLKLLSGDAVGWR
jgi:aminoglycoside 2''-phosphotransferase